MIFVAVGTQKFQFDRLLKSIDELIEREIIKDEVYAQIGNCDYMPKYYGYERFMNKEDFNCAIQNCTLLITHSGVATIMLGVKAGKHVIVMPRLAKYEEHVDDHQIEIAEVFSKLKYVIYCNDERLLEEVINFSAQAPIVTYNSNRSRIVEEVKRFLEK